MSSSPDEGEVARVRHLLASRHPYVIGCDEVGMGAWAGPVFVAATVFDSTWLDPKVKDSKKYSGKTALIKHNKRVLTVEKHIKPKAVHIAIACMSSRKLDEVGIDDAWMILMRRVIQECLLVKPGATVVVDGSSVRGLPGSTMAMPGADSYVPSVSAASVCAKATRDAVMQRVSLLYPQYGFEANVGYGTTEHEDAINSVGLCPLHRRSYSPIQNYVRHGRTRLRR